MTSVFLPFVAKNASASDITHVFQNFCQLGVVSRVDIVNNKKKNGSMAYVHFASWANDEHSLRFQTQIANGESVKVFYNDNQYWNVVANTYTPSPSTPTKTNKARPVPPGAPVKKAKVGAKVAPIPDAEITEDLVDATYVSHLEEELAKCRNRVHELEVQVYEVDSELQQAYYELRMYKPM
jgi:hypothetical protein